MSDSATETAVGRYGRVSQRGTGAVGPYWTGKVVAQNGYYLKFERSTGGTRWYHRRDVLLYPLKEGENHG